MGGAEVARERDGLHQLGLACLDLLRVCRRDVFARRHAEREGTAELVFVEFRPCMGCIDLVHIHRRDLDEIVAGLGRTGDGAGTLLAVPTLLPNESMDAKLIHDVDPFYSRSAS